MRKSFLNRVLSTLIILGLAISSNLVACAASGEAMETAGSVSVIGRTGFNGGNVYANFNASDYVDVEMRGTCQFLASSGVGEERFTSYFEQRMYGSREINYPNTVVFVCCGFGVDSNDGSTTLNVYAGNHEG